jgi:prephenate dehydratase
MNTIVCVCEVNLKGWGSFWYDSRMKIGYQGVSGAYSESAAEDFVKKNSLKKVAIIGCPDFETVFKNVESGEFRYGVIPVENSLAGSIHKNFDLLNRHDLKVVGEVYVHVQHQLLGLKNSKKENIKEIYSHFQALAQCEHNIKTFFPDAKPVEYFDTAGSAELIKNLSDASKACIASAKAGKINGLKVLYKNFQDDKENYTRFLIVAKEYAKFENHKPVDFYKTSLVFAGGNVTGFLFKALGCFALRDINLTKIESRPMPKSPWKYYFYLDFHGKYDDEKVKNAINNLKEVVSEVKILGSYKASKI